MQFYVDTTVGPARRAKYLKKALAKAGYDMKLTACQRLIAQMMGFRGWQELIQSIGMADLSLGDAFVDDVELNRRRDQHIRVLMDAGIAEADAEEAVDTVRPTDYGEPRASDTHDDKEFLEEWGLRVSSRVKYAATE